MVKVTVFWFRRDLRWNDNAGLFNALKAHTNVLPIFIFDKTILQELPKNDARVEFIHEALMNIQETLIQHHSSLKIFHSTPQEAFEILMKDYEIEAVYTNHDYEPYAQQRDSAIQHLLQKKQIEFKTFKDQVIFEKNEVVKEDGLPYTVFTPFSKKWKAKLNDYFLKEYPTKTYAHHFFKTKAFYFPSLSELGFAQSGKIFSSTDFNKHIITDYHNTRDIPSIEGTTKMSIHLRFGTISIRQLAKNALQINEKYLNELIWRDFYQTIIWHFPKVVNQSFKSKYDNIQWRNNEQEFNAWCAGQTGYPIVDAGMRELNETGWMHNRVRMVVASFLTKHLLIDWRWGESYFALKLNDFDLASNNGGWQWAAGSGCDAAPYFRVFNPYLQTAKFDKDLKYIKKWVPEFEDFTYPKPIVEHDFARKRCLEVYKAGLDSSQ
jgi:deoxyribodipyrimidine photo-lyase